MTVLLQVSDQHFGTEEAVVVDALAALACQQRPDLVELSGDITQRARPAQLRAARAFADQLGAPAPPPCALQRRLRRRRRTGAPLAVTRDEDLPHRLRGHAAALQRWAEAGADLVMGGHIHLPYVMALQGLVRPMWAVQARTAVSTRGRTGVPNSVNLLRWGTAAPFGTCEIEQWDFGANRRAFACTHVIDIDPTRC